MKRIKNFSVVLFFLMISMQQAFPQYKIENKNIEIKLLNNEQFFWQYKIKQNKEVFKMKAPAFEIDGKQVICTLAELTQVSVPSVLKNGVSEYTFQGKVKSVPDVELRLIFQIAPDNAVVRYKYVLSSSGKSMLTKTDGKDQLVYFSTSFAPFKQVKEVQISNYDEKFHSYKLKEQIVEDRYFENNASVMGPILIAGNYQNSFLLAYEHGSHYGNEFLHFNLQKDRSVNLAAVKGNYVDNQPLSKGNEYETVWLEIAGIQGNEDALAAEYRSFMLKYISQNLESRKPYIYYNTWGRQEREKWAGNTYLNSMNLKQTLEEIEQAKKLGVDVFVLDVGWFTKTGDWEVNTSEKFFPDTLSQVKSLLKKYNMKLGLWFNPTLAGTTTRITAKNIANRAGLDGNLRKPQPSWETEESYPMCMASSFWVDFSNELIRLVKEHDVCYFKWDAIWQGDCDVAGHFHGTEQNTMDDRRQNAAFLQPIYMSKIVDRVSESCPEAIFDFDITEEGRCMGLSFLASGKYFAINNGPYSNNYDLKRSASMPSNIFVNPGPARPWIVRSILTYDKWIPSTLFLTHYQLEGPVSSQTINIASLILGQNGIWGEILKISPEGTKLAGDVINRYKQIRDDITLSLPLCYGLPGESVEIHEKINPLTGKGAVVIFGIRKGEINYITNAKVDVKHWQNEGVSVSFDEKGRAIIHATFTETNAKMIFFGVE